MFVDNPVDGEQLQQQLMARGAGNKTASVKRPINE
jgi:hypothetical protein